MRMLKYTQRYKFALTQYLFIHRRSVVSQFSTTDFCFYCVIQFHSKQSEKLNSVQQKKIATFFKIANRRKQLCACTFKHKVIIMS